MPAPVSETASTAPSPAAPDGPPPVPRTRSAHRIDHLAEALGLRSYLEIGVLKGHTLLNVRMDERTGVDPNFRFDPAERAAPGLTFHNELSDDFFASLPADRTFDIVFLDGLHTFAQTYRDLVNALAHTGPRGVVLIDDTLPNDAYSALADRQLMGRARRATGSQGATWHGDVYKVVHAVHDFHPRLDYRTIEGPGNPQTLVWRAGPGAPRAPRLDSFEAIDRLSYFEMLDAMDVMRMSGEEETLQACVDALTREA